MDIKVTTENVVIDQESLNKGEYNIRECNFELVEEFTGLVCKALFTVRETNLTYQQDIVNNKCTIPYETTKQKGIVEVGVIAYEVNGEELIKRYSPAPDVFFVIDGSYVEDIENQSTPTPTELEQLEQRVSQVEIDAAQVEINTQDISDIKQEQTTQNNDILLRSLITETGSQIELSLNSTNFKMTATLKDKNGTVVNTSNEIDLPLESVVINASYDNTTKEIILTLQNGNTVRVSIADLVSGLVSNTDYATDNKYGVVKGNTWYGSSIDNGTIKGVDVSYSQYQERGSQFIIDKGTLENVITGKQLVNETQLDESQATQDDLIEALQTENARIKATLPTTTGEGENITISKTAELEFIQPPYPRGNSEQVQYSGKNLLNYNSFSNTIKDSLSTLRLVVALGEQTQIVYTNNNQPIGKVSFSFTPNSNYSKFMIKHNGSSQDIRININFDFESGKTYYFTLNVTGNNPSVIGGFSFDEVMLSTTGGDYEPYVGGTASPNPSYPQPITNVTGDVEVLVQNKNLFDKDNIVSGKRLDNSGEATIDEPSYCTTNYFIPVKPNTSYYSSVAISQSRAFCFYDSSKNFISRTMYTGQNVITTTSDTYYMKISILLSEIDTEQLEQGTATTYTPHKEQTFLFPLGTQRMYLGDYLADDGIHHVRGQVVLDGTEKFTTVSVGINSYALNNVIAVNYDMNKLQIMSNYFKGIPAINRNTDETVIYVSANNQFIIRNTSFNSITELKTWIAEQYANSTPLIVQYELAEEEITPYTTEQQQAYDEIKQALSYEEQTNISGSSDEAMPLFSVEAYQSIKLVLAG